MYHALLCQDRRTVPLSFFVICAAPILAEGDVLGSVLIAGEEGELGSGETEYKLLQTMSGFLGRHMEG